MKKRISNVLSANQVEPLAGGGTCVASEDKDAPGWKKLCSNPRELAELETVGLSKAKRAAHRLPYVRTEAAKTFQGLYMETLDQMHDMTGEMHKYRSTSLLWMLERVQAWVKRKWTRSPKPRIWRGHDHIY